MLLYLIKQIIIFLTEEIQVNTFVDNNISFKRKITVQGYIVKNSSDARKFSFIIIDIYWNHIIKQDNSQIFRKIIPVLFLFIIFLKISMSV